MFRLKQPLVKKNLFLTKRAKPRKILSRSPFKFSAQELDREYGSRYQTIDIHIGDVRLILDFVEGVWKLDEPPISPEELVALEKQRSELAEENTYLRAKLDILFELVAQTTAEQDLRRETSQSSQ
ncbi:unnamed protein product [Rotaria magnacalcarata]|uniref:Uncharacterized protein n=1 Tax=Rotaria magnacalcarata TaxID=392030 RepID=A0A816H7G1_9BILA|nr:unnamed protein product [Rotaria magnacalcarata]CAF1683990.1 unnamed protein product [Rotaria magnacalcarata]CAF2047610.1 unnamed protein product [Rotaria magnacalcarata]CAF2196240.1 unnamed protein product [Rotaria magnacalcarata]CAF2214403.1 unnamed protein product [Rotaria magnacalcarata]